MMPPITLRQLRYLTAVAEHRHFGRAADACAVTQSTLSAGLAELEGQLGVTLADRNARVVRLTPIGEEITRRAQRILSEAGDLVAVAKHGQTPLSGPLRIGVIPTVGPFLLPRVLPALKARFPALQLWLREDLTARLIEGVHAGALDAAILALPCAAGEVETRVLLDDPFLLAVPIGHPLAGGAPPIAALSVDAVPYEGLLLLEDGHCLRDHALAACNLAARRAGAAPGAFAATSLLTLVQMVAAGLGHTLLPQIAADCAWLVGSGVAVRPLTANPGEAPPQRRIGLVWRHKAAGTAELDLLAATLRGILAAPPPPAPAASAAAPPAPAP